MDFAPLLDAATAALRDEVGHTELSAPALLKESHRSRTVRCQAVSALYKPRSVIIKQILDDPACGYSDWASHRFLTGLPAAKGLAPRFLAGNESAGVFVLEDLGAGTNLDGLFVSSEDGDVLPALESLGSVMATLHAVTAPEFGAFESLRRSLPGAMDTGRHREAVKWLHAREKWQAWFEALGIEPPDGFDRGVKWLAELYARPGQWLAFTHGDPAPTNHLFRDEKAVLLDFEYGAFRHLLYDATAWHVLCPLPERWMGAFKKSFRRTLLDDRPELGAEFEAQWSALCLYRAFAILSWLPTSVLEADQPWVGDWSARQALRAALTVPPNSLAVLDGMAQCARSLLAGLENRCPELAGRPMSPWA